MNAADLQWDRPRITVARNADGDFTSADGQVLVVRLLTEPRWMLFIDRRPIARTRTVAEATERAWNALHEPSRSARR